MSTDPRTLTHWFVETPTYPVTEYVCEYGGPTYDISDFLEIDAPTRREAISIAVRRWLAERCDNYCKEQRLDNRSPFKGIKATSRAELKATTRAAPPDQPPDYCDTCPSNHALVGVGGRWVWRDDGDEPGDDWGWFGTCDIPPEP